MLSFVHSRKKRPCEAFNRQFISSRHVVAVAGLAPFLFLQLMEQSIRTFILRTAHVLLLVIMVSSAFGQKDNRKLVQFSGVVVASDSLSPVPFTNILIQNTRRGTMTDVYGYFSFVAQLSDTIIFSSIGYQRSNYIVPSDLDDSKYSLIHMMERDTIILDLTTIYPWPTKEQFREAFLNLHVPDDLDARVARNLAENDMAALMASMPMDASENFRYSMHQDQTKLYYSGQAPPINIFNPVAWSQFINAWQRGDFKKKKDR